MPPPPTSSPGHGDPRTKRTLDRFALEAASSECALWLTSGSALTAWSLALGGDAGTVSSVQSIATAAQAMHLPAAMISARASRRTVALVALGAARLAWLPLVALALSPTASGTGRLVLLGTALASSVLTMFAQNAQGAWMGDVIPSEARGRFFGRRTWVAALGGSCAALVIAAVLDGGRATESLGRVPTSAVAALGLVVVALGAVSVALLSGAHEPARERPALDARRAIVLLTDPALRRFLRYQVAWGVAVAPGAAFFALHVLETLRGGYRLLAAHGIVLVLARLLTARIWGARVDRFGASRELALCSAGIGVMPLLWTLCDERTWWPLALDAVLSGVLWGGQSIAASAHPLGIGHSEDRPFVLAWSSLALGLSWACAALVAGAIARHLPTDVLGVGPYRVLFVFSGLARASCAYWALHLDEEPALASSATRSHA